ncbi:MAG: hybrid sensor histidine kinase/response regulator [Desulfobacterales bacterium]|nr:hybrid sensor histidine kinase/response regulator [Desulfobacterales bacterium]
MADTILIVDPSGNIPAAMSELPAVRILMVRSGSEALEGLYNRKTALILVDEGFEPLAAADFVFSARNIRPDLPIAVMAEPEKMDRAMKIFGMAVTDYINKPVSPTAISLSLQRGIQGKTPSGMPAFVAHLAPMAHGVYGMLTALDGGFYQLESGLAGKTPQRIDAGLETVRNTCFRLRCLVMDILEYVRAENVRTKLADVGEIARSALKAVVPAARQAGVDITVDISPDVGAAVVDPLRFQGALERLLGAAVAEISLREPPGKHTVCVTLKPGWGGRLRLEIRLRSVGSNRWETMQATGTDFDAALTRLTQFVACHMIRQQGGMVQGDETFPAIGWVIDIPGESKQESTGLDPKSNPCKTKHGLSI